MLGESGNSHPSLRDALAFNSQVDPPILTTAIDVETKQEVFVDKSKNQTNSRTGTKPNEKSISGIAAPQVIKISGKKKGHSSQKRLSPPRRDPYLDSQAESIKVYKQKMKKWSQDKTKLKKKLKEDEREKKKAEGVEVVDEFIEDKKIKTDAEADEKTAGKTSNYSAAKKIPSQSKLVAFRDWKSTAEDKAGEGTFKKYVEDKYERKIKEFLDYSGPRYPPLDKKADKKVMEKRHQEALRKHKEIISYKLREIEGQSAFQTELDFRIELLRKQREDHDSMVLKIKKVCQRIKELENQLLMASESSQGMKSAQAEDERVDKLKHDIQLLDTEFGEQDLRRDQLKHMHDRYKADILALKEKRKNLTYKHQELSNQFSRFEIQNKPKLAKAEEKVSLIKEMEKRHPPLFGSKTESSFFTKKNSMPEGKQQELVSDGTKKGKDHLAYEELEQMIRTNSKKQPLSYFASKNSPSPQHKKSKIPPSIMVLEEEQAQRILDERVLGELKSLHVRRMLEKIEEHEKVVESDEQNRIRKIALEKQNYIRIQVDQEYKRALAENARLHQKWNEMEEKYQNISRATIEEVDILKQKKEKLHMMIEENQQTAETLEKEIAFIKHEYMKEKYGKDAMTERPKSGKEAEQSEVVDSNMGGSPKLGGNTDTVGDTFKISSELAISQNAQIVAEEQADAAELFHLELELTKSNKALMEKENEMKRLSSLVRDCRTTVSRIFYQLAREKSVNQEIPEKQLETALSKLGMELEKRLSYIHSKNKAIKDENVLMVVWQ